MTLRKMSRVLLLLLSLATTSTAYNGKPFRSTGGGDALPRKKSMETATAPQQPWWARVELPPGVENVLDQAGEDVAKVFEWEHERAARFERIGSVPYFFDPRIHNFGNSGWRGALHALVVPIATHAIDRFAYSGVDARQAILEAEIAEGDEVVDLCSGVGFSSARVGRVTAVDTSAEMLAVARLRRPDLAGFMCDNAETFGEPKSCDVATIMFGMHEMPGDARRRVLRNALRIAREKVLVVDIWPGFEPSPMMLSGEPYVLGYLAHIEGDVAAALDAARGVDDVEAELAAGRRPSEWSVEAVDVVSEHVRMWRFERLEWGI